MLKACSMSVSVARALASGAVPEANTLRAWRLVSSPRPSNSLRRLAQSEYTSARSSAACRPPARTSGATAGSHAPEGGPTDATLTAAGIFDSSNPRKMGVSLCRTRMVRGVKLRCRIGASFSDAPCSSHNARTADRANVSRAGICHEASVARFSIEGATGSTTVKNWISPAYPGAG